MLAPSTRAADLAAGRRALQQGVQPDVIALCPSLPVARRTHMGVPVGVRANLAPRALERPLRHRPRLRAGPAEPLLSRPAPRRVALRGDVPLAGAARLPTRAAPSARSSSPGWTRCSRRRPRRPRPRASASPAPTGWSARASTPSCSRRGRNGSSRAGVAPGRETARARGRARARRRCPAGSSAPARRLSGARPAVAAPPEGPGRRQDGARPGVTRRGPQRGRAVRARRSRQPGAASRSKPPPRAHRSQTPRLEARSGETPRRRRASPRYARSLDELDRLYRALAAGAASSDEEPLSDRDWIPCDLHMHTSWSHDCSIAVAGPARPRRGDRARRDRRHRPQRLRRRAARPSSSPAGAASSSSRARRSRPTARAR